MILSIVAMWHDVHVFKIKGSKKQKQTISSRQIDESVPISDFFPPNYPPCSSITTSSVICPSSMMPPAASADLLQH
jgi:hypothetical protein